VKEIKTNPTFRSLRLLHAGYILEMATAILTQSGGSRKSEEPRVQRAKRAKRGVHRVAQLSCGSSDRMPWS